MFFASLVKNSSKKIKQAVFTHPFSRIALSWELVSRRGSPVPSVATASNSSKGGAINKSLKLIGRGFLLTVPVAGVGVKGAGRSRVS